METTNKKAEPFWLCLSWAFYVFRLKLQHQAWFSAKVGLIVYNPTMTNNEKLFLMPRVALTEETGIILARHLKSCKRRTPSQTPFSLDHGPMAVMRLFAWGSLRRLYVLILSKNRAKTNIFSRFLLSSVIRNTYQG
jgi:hypothetical protein